MYIQDNHNDKELTCITLQLHLLETLTFVDGCGESSDRVDCECECFDKEALTRKTVVLALITPLVQKWLHICIKPLFVLVAASILVSYAGQLVRTSKID